MSCEHRPHLAYRDTLSSVGEVFHRTLPFTGSNTSIRVFRQALALHERWLHLHPKFYEVRWKKPVDMHCLNGVATTDSVITACSLTHKMLKTIPTFKRFGLPVVIVVRSIAVCCSL